MQEQEAAANAAEAGDLDLSMWADSPTGMGLGYGAGGVMVIGGGAAAAGEEPRGPKSGQALPANIDMAQLRQQAPIQQIQCQTATQCGEQQPAVMVPLGVLGTASTSIAAFGAPQRQQQSSVQPLPQMQTEQARDAAQSPLQREQPQSKKARVEEAAQQRRSKTTSQGHTQAHGVMQAQESSSVVSQARAPSQPPAQQRQAVDQHQHAAAPLQQQQHDHAANQAQSSVNGLHVSLLPLILSRVITACP